MSKKVAERVKSDDHLVQVPVAGAIAFETNTEFLTGIVGNWETLAASMDMAQELVKTSPEYSHEGYVMFDAALGALSKDLELIQLFYGSMHETTAEEIESDSVEKYNFVPLPGPRKRKVAVS